MATINVVNVLVVCRGYVTGVLVVRGKNIQMDLIPMWHMATVYMCTLSKHL